MSSEQNERSYKTVWIILGIIVALCAIAVFFSSCNAERKMAAMAVRHPDAALKVCALVAPTKKEVVTNTETKIVTGPTIYDTALVYIDCDSVVKESQRNPKVLTKMVRVPCPASTHRVDSVFTTVTITITKTDTKQVTLLQKELTASKSDTERLQKGRSTWRWIALGLIVCIVGFGAFKIFGKVNPLKWFKKKQS